MAWFKKKETKLEKINRNSSELPPLPLNFGEDFPPMKISNIAPEEIKDELPPLPAFSGSEVQGPLIEPFQRPLTREIDEGEISRIQPRIKEIRPYVKVEPIYIRIDKYQDAMASFQEVKKKLLEIENLLRNIKEIKAKEDSELQQWEQEMQQAKDKLASIDATIFKKLEE